MNLVTEVRRVSLAQRLIGTNGRPSGFDYLRLILAIGVAISHSRGVTTGTAGIPLLYRLNLVDATVGGNPLTAPILPMFFALSGFLVAGSLERSKTLLTFLGLRVIRIYPALAVEIVLSALLIGTAVTSLPLASYFQDPLFWSYLLNAIGDIHYKLPGVFVNSPTPDVVNAQLWTVPYELLCYVALAALVLCGAVQRKFLIPLGAAGLALARLCDYQLPIGDIKLNAQIGFDGPLLIVCFLAGVSFYLFRNKIAWCYPLFFGALMASIALIWFIPFGEYPAILTLTYVTVYFGLTNTKRLFLIKGADYSYGIYLYHFVIIQLFVYLAAPRSGWFTAIICVPLSALVAACSWHFIEKPAQHWRKPLIRAEQHYLALKSRLLSW
jgi:peptidoglycan/LPS O-acetylase OafA/YrhL